MKKISKLMVLLMVAILVLGSFAACGKKEDEKPANTTANESNDSKKDDDAAPVDADPAEATPVTLKVWCPENQIQNGTMDTMAESFQELHPEWDITFTIEVVGEDVAKEQVLKDVAAAGDVYFFANDQLNELVNAGAIAKLGGRAEELVKTTMAETVADTVTASDGSIYGIPFTHNTFFMFYDKSILTEEDVKTMEGIMSKPTADNVYNFHFDSAGGWKLGSWFYGAGLTIYGDNGLDFAAGANWNNGTGLAVTNYLIDLIGNPKTAFEGDVSLSELAADHRIGAWWDGSWNYQMYKDALGDDLGLAVLPTFNPDGNDYQLKGFYGSKAIGVNPQASNMQVAVEFATYLGSEEMQVKRFIESGQVPTNLNAAEAPEVKADPVATVIVNEASVASVMQPTSAEFGSRYWSNVGALATEIKSGELNKTNAQEKLDTFVGTLVVQ
ncbi:MAG TPA: extracellular solute-binding protein [Clostridiales bacterium]|nr:extracellular solute-binding protein [Clostridiales bacterium]